MNHRLRIDIESYSDIDLKEAGVYRYSESPQFEILMCGWSFDGSTIEVAVGNEIENIPGLLDPDVTHVAWNTNFERVCFSRWAGLPTGDYLSPNNWHDPMAIAAERGYSRVLEATAKRLAKEQKDSAGTRLINLFCKPYQGKRRMPEDYPEEWAEFCRYCGQDVVTLAELDQILGGWPTAAEHQTWLADQIINDRGIKVDVQLAKEAVEAAENNRIEQELEIINLTGIKNPGSVMQMKAWATAQGLPMRNMRSETVTAALEGNLDPVPRRVLVLRQELALSAFNKYEAALNGVCEDGRIRGQFSFFGAHTGRWSGQGVQPQNLPRAHISCDLGKECPGPACALCIGLERDTMLDLFLGNGATAHELRALIRPMFIGPFTVVDFASIEARVIAWLAGERWALDAFRAGRDIYIETATRMSTPTNPLDRSQGKVAVLALGYQGAVNSLRRMGATGTDEFLRKLVVQWRNANRRIVDFWQALQDGCAQGGKAGRINITREGPDVKLWLPSGRALIYHDMKFDYYRVQDPVTEEWVKKEGYRFTSGHGGRTGTYGGKLAENVTQAVARDLMAAALVTLENEGYPVEIHVHDEVAVAGHHDVDTISKLMCAAPAWAKGLPMAAAGFQTLRYRKG